MSNGLRGWRKLPSFFVRRRRKTKRKIKRKNLINIIDNRYTYIYNKGER